jgi:Tat protein translocase TatB subunit
VAWQACSDKKICAKKSVRGEGIRMFGMGWPEIFVVIAIAIMVIGPEQLPGVARTIGRMLAQFKRAANDLKTAVGDEIAQHEEFKDFKEFSSDIESEVRNITGSAQDYMQSEMEKGEKELDKLEKDLASTNEDIGDVEALDANAGDAAEGGDAVGDAKAGNADGDAKGGNADAGNAEAGDEAKGGNADGDNVVPSRKETA